MEQIPLLDYCHTHNIELTPIRREVLGFLWQQHKPTKAYTIIPYLKEKGIGSPVPMTVYRALEYLECHHLVHKIHALNSYVACKQYDTQHLSALMLLCDTCGVAQEVNDIALKNVTTTTHHNFVIEQQLLEVHGKCGNCV